eukprot:363721-Chlamydomonas_euryale.AAC.3
MRTRRGRTRKLDASLESLVESVRSCARANLGGIAPRREAACTSRHAAAATRMASTPSLKVAC